MPAQVVDKYKGPSPKVGEVIDVNVKRLLPWANITKAVAKSLPLISTALAIKDIADSIRCREAPGGLAECDEGSTPQQVSAWCAGSGYCTHGSAQSAADAYVVRVYGSASQACSGGSVVGPRTASAVRNVTASSAAYDVVATRTNYQFGNCTGTVTSVIPNQVQAGPLSTWTSGTTAACGPIVIQGVTYYPVPGPDNKCPTNVYSPASENDVATKAETWGDKTKAPLIVGDLSAAGKPVEHPHPEIDPVPDSVVGPRETTTHPDGSTTIRDTIWDLAPTPTGYGWVPRTVVKDYPPGATIPPPGTVSDGTTTTGSAPKEDPITCGLPNTPACKIDETGTPTTATIPKAEVDSAKGDALGKITDIGTIQAPAWTWSFALPSNCSPITVGPFLTQSVVVDLCQYQAMIHDLVALIWAAFTVWACVGMVGRTFATG
jgi:hypothetical protein